MGERVCCVRQVLLRVTAGRGGAAGGGRQRGRGSEGKAREEEGGWEPSAR